jgi:thioredoxin reductase (NADPH)
MGTSTIDYDIVIIGGGPAGLTAGIYASRNRLQTLLLERGLCGGLPATTNFIENYPGHPEGINGMELVKKFKEQALKFGAVIQEYQEVKKIEQVGKRIRVIVPGDEYYARAAIIASGSIPQRLNIPGENELMGKGVSYCATCDGPLYRDKDVAVIGCGNSGLQEGEALLKHVKSVTFVECLPHMTGEKILQERLQNSSKTRFFLNHSLVSINGNSGVNSITLRDRERGIQKNIEITGVFIYAGFIPNSDFGKGVLELDEKGYIVTNEKMETSLPGVFAAGDVRAGQVRQISTACGTAVIAVINADCRIREQSELSGSGTKS